MITDGNKWHYLAVEKLTGLLMEVTSKYAGDFQYLKFLHSYRAENMLKRIIMYVKIMIIFIQKYLMKKIKYLNTTMGKSQ